MRSRLKRWAAMTAFVLGVFALVLSFIPILFPLTVVAATLAILGGGLLLLMEERAVARPLSWQRLSRILRRPEEEDVSPVALRSARALRVATLGLLWNCILYLVLGIHSWLCFVHSFNTELEPLRKAFRVIASEPTGGAKQEPKQESKTAVPPGPATQR